MKKNKKLKRKNEKLNRYDVIHNADSMWNRNHLQNPNFSKNRDDALRDKNSHVRNQGDEIDKSDLELNLKNVYSKLFKNGDKDGR